MFKIDVSKTYKYPVNVTMLNEKGKASKMSFTALFNRLPQSDIDRLFAQIGDESVSDEQWIAEILAGWEGIKDSEGQDVEFNDHNVRMVCDIYPVRPSIVEAWGESLKEVARKN